MDWPAEGPLELPAIEATIQNASSLTGGTLKVKQNKDHIALDISAADRSVIATVIELAVDCKAVDIAPVNVE